jgi:hypothetical protein
MSGVSAYRFALGLITTALCFLQAACTSSSAYRLDGSDPLPSVIGSVSVEVSADLPTDRASRLREVSGTGRLRQAVVDELGGANLWKPGLSTSLKVVIVGVRVRSGAGSTTLGGMSGDDHLAIEVDVLTGDDQIARIQASASSARSGLFAYSVEKRLDNLCRATSKELVAVLADGGAIAGP